MRVIEYRITGKSREPDRCEDAIAITECYVAVIDGATDTSGRLINGRTPGKAIADLLAEFFMKEKRRLFGMELVEELNKHVRHFLGASDPAQSTEGLPSASIAVFTQGLNRLTLVGEVCGERKTADTRYPEDRPAPWRSPRAVLTIVASGGCFGRGIEAG